MTGPANNPYFNVGGTGTIPVSAAPFRHACKLPAKSVVIGDSASAAEGARAAGCKVLLVTYGYNEGRDVRALDAGGVVETLDEAACRILS